MSLFNWLFGNKGNTTAVYAELPGPGLFGLEVVGTSKYQRALAKAAGGYSDESVDIRVHAFLVFENDNPYDANAVKVMIDRRLVGYLKRNDAKNYRQQILKNGRGDLVGRCSAKIIGGWDRGPDDRGNFGVRLDLPCK